MQHLDYITKQAPCIIKRLSYWCVLNYEEPSRNKSRIDRAIFSLCSHRGVSAPFSRDGAIRFCTCLEKQSSHRGHRERGEKILGNANFQVGRFFTRMKNTLLHPREGSKELK